MQDVADVSFYSLCDSYWLRFFDLSADFVDLFLYGTLAEVSRRVEFH